MSEDAEKVSEGQEISQEDKKVIADKIISGMKDQKVSSLENDVIVLREQNDKLIKCFNQLVEYLKRKLGD